MQIETLNVDLNERSYPIYIGQSILSSSLFNQHIASTSQVFIVTNEKIAPLYLAELKQKLQGYECDDFILPDGESYKTLESVAKVIDQLIENNYRRNATLIALGGGVIGDITGFAASCYQRGIAYIQIPTTLLSQVDASVGGKTGVNHPSAKNMIGAFHQPSAVFIDLFCLNTLSPREFHSGLAEIIKIALVGDAAFFDWLEVNMEKIIQRDPQALSYAIKKACDLKISIVTQDEKESGIRAWLNFGHTFGHAVEHVLGYGSWLHGEAVAVGMVLAADYSSKLGWINPSIFERIKNILTKAKLPIRLPNSVSAAQMIASMKADKKKDTHQLKLVLLQGIGQVVVYSNIDPKLLEATIIENQL